MYKTTIPTVITNGHFNKETTLAELKRIGAERIALAVDRELEYKFSSTQNLSLLKELIGYFKKNEIEVLVWLGETFGHEGGKPIGVQPYMNIRLIDEGDIKAFCPLDEKFKKDVCSWVVKVAECGAEMIMLDDDFRLGLRPGLGCCCDLHMAELERELGEKIPVKQIRRKFFHGGRNKYRSAWLKVQRESVYRFARSLREALDCVNPKVRLGICCALGSWDAEGIDVIECAKILAGNTVPFVRICGAPYWASQQPEYNRLADVIEAARTQLDWCKMHGIEVITEGDTYPRPRFATPASYLECFDMILRADGNSDGILKYALDYISDADYETGYVDASVRNRGLYKWIDKEFSGKKCVGVRPYNVMHLLEDAKLDAEKANIWEEVQTRSVRYPSLRFGILNSLPISYEKENVNILFGENAKYISCEELKNGNIIDLTAAQILMSRGIDVGIQSFTDFDTYIKSSFSVVPQEYFMDEGIYTRLSDGVDVSKIEHETGVRILTKYKYPFETIAGAFEYENAENMRFLVYPFDADKARNIGKGWFDSYARRRQVIKSIAWLGEKELDVYADGNYPYLYIMAKENRDGIIIGLWNLFEDVITNARIFVKACGENIEFANCHGHREGDVVILDTPLYPYEFAGIQCSSRKKEAF